MSKSLSAFVLACLALLLVVWPLTLQRPGLPYSLKADEPAYYLAARSLWADHDLRCETRDLMRVSDDFMLEPENLILMTRDGWRTAYFGKPYFGSLLAAPAVAAFGPRGFIALNMAYLLGAIFLGWRFLRRANPSPEALFFSAAYYLVSTATIYAFWLQPEMLSLLSVAASLYCAMGGAGESTDGDEGHPGWFDRCERRLLGGPWRWLLAGLVIGPAVSAKPVFAAALAPAIVAGLRPFRPMALVRLGIGVAAATGLIALGQYALTGAWSPYLDVDRQGFKVHSPLMMPTPTIALPSPAAASGTAAATPAAAATGKGSWSWIFAWPGIDLRRFPMDLRNYFIGRHTGAFIFYPFLAVALIFFLVGGGARDPRRLALLGGFAAFVLFFVVWNPNNYHGGSGFVGNRYLVSFYPFGLYLVHRLKPRAWILAGFLGGGLFLGQILFAPLGPPVDEGTLQAYARAEPFRVLPYEFTLPRSIPGYRGVTQAEAHIRGRKDRMRLAGGWIRTLGAGSAEFFFSRVDEPKSAAFLVRAWAPGTVVRFRMGASHETLRFPDEAPPSSGFGAIVSLDLGPPDVRFQEWQEAPDERIWYLTVSTSRAARPSWWGYGDDELIGVEMLHVGSRDVLDRDVYGARWSVLDVPVEVAAASRFTLPVRVQNASPSAWTAQSPVQVRLAYRWLDPEQDRVLEEGLRTDLVEPVAAGAEVAVVLEIATPQAPGRYRLALEPVYEHVRWFTDRDAESRRSFPIRVVAGGAPPAATPTPTPTPTP